ncbi:MAG: hypothetical protein FJ270_02820 [Planctomycetes bacterium]|nr:hypothetical protein [Planctomycetota bacterium]
MLGACASSDQVQDQSEPTIDITVLVDEGVKGDDRAQFQPARYTLFPDGALHGQANGGLTIRDRPPRVRVLSPTQLKPIWDRFEAVMDAQPPFPPGAPGSDMPWITAVRPTPGDVTIIVWMTHDQRGTWSVTRLDAAAREQPNEVASLVRTLASACWMDDLPTDGDLPMRYDFGADPYATMRGNAALTTP